MKSLKFQRALALLAIPVFAILPSFRANGQDTQTAPAAAPQVPTSAPSDATTPQSYRTPKIVGIIPRHNQQPSVPMSEEVTRYVGFFNQVYTWDLFAKQADKSGDAGWAEHWRTRLQKMSGLTAVQADAVTKVALKWQADVSTGAITPNGRDESVNRCIAELVATLGSRPFSRLDQFTRHMNDQSNSRNEKGRANKSSVMKEQP
jgi:hypothetical protein